jgi:cobalt/nickel transport system permease protein
MAGAVQTPDWLLQPELGLCPCGCIGRRRRVGFVEKTISGGAGVLQQVLFGEDVARQPGLLQRVDPRVKAVTVLGLLVAAALVRHVPVLLALYGVTLLLAVASRVSLRFFVKRVWLFIPIFTGIVVLPATLSFVTPGDTVASLGPLAVTSQGLAGAALIVTRVAVSISLVVLLTLTTPWPRLLAALRALFVPRLFVLVIGMAYRYLFVLLGAVADMYTARKARPVAAGDGAREGRGFVSATAGALFGRAHALSEEVHLAMVARGYRGDSRTLDATRLRPLDLFWTLGCAAFAVAVLWLDGGLHV